jgi:hypothetical protein|tara:strand:+ start:1185 stop:1385 length:201 start_codon:yes stop_codon:yes gene_type:complete
LIVAAAQVLLSCGRRPLVSAAHSGREGQERLWRTDQQYALSKSIATTVAPAAARAAFAAAAGDAQL